MGAGRPPLPPLLQFLSSSGDRTANSPDTPCIPEEMKNASLSLGLQRAACDIHSRLGLGEQGMVFNERKCPSRQLPALAAWCPDSAAPASPSCLLHLDTEEDSYQMHVQRSAFEVAS